MKLLGFLLLIQLTTTALQASRKMVKNGNNITIDCSLLAEEGVYWFLHGENAKPEFLLYVSGLGKRKPPHSNKYIAQKSFKKVSLTVNNFAKGDSGKYYCFMIKSMVMQFGTTQEYYLEEIKTTPKPTTTTPKTTLNTPENTETTPYRSTERGTQQDLFTPDLRAVETNVKSPPELVINKDEMSCHIIILAPLAGAAFLLLLALILVSVVFCRKTVSLGLQL
ncbi:putative immune-type receptor 10a [Cetorhinus maximus]